MRVVIYTTCNVPGGVELWIDGMRSIWFKIHAANFTVNDDFWADTAYQLGLAAGAGVPVISFVLDRANHVAESGTDWIYPQGQLGNATLTMVAAIDKAYKTAAGVNATMPYLWPTVYPQWPDAEPVITIDRESGGQRKEFANSPSSSWANRTATQLRILLQSFDQHFQGRMLGLHLSGLQTTEWFFEGMWGAELNAFADYSNSSLRAWCATELPATHAHAAGTAHDHERRAQMRTTGADSQDPHSACQAAPTPSERGANRTGNTLAVDSSGNGSRAARFNTFLSSRTARTLGDLATAVKEATDGKALVGFYYGYLFGLAGRRLTGSGHLALSYVLDHPAIDAIVSPYDYSTEVRSPTGPLLGHVPMDSAALRGKLYIIEDDSRTVLSSPNGREIHRTATVAASAQVLARNLMTSALHGVGTYLYDMNAQGWWGQPSRPAESRALWSVVAQARQYTKDRMGWPPHTLAEQRLRADKRTVVGTDVLPEPSSTNASSNVLARARPAAGRPVRVHAQWPTLHVSATARIQVALIIDDASPAYFGTQGGPIPWGDPGNGFSSALHYWPSHALARLGAPFRTYLIRDLLLPAFQNEVAPALRLVVFANALHIPDTVMAYVQGTLASGNRTLLWVWAPNCIRLNTTTGEASFDPTGPATLTGVPITVGKGEASLEVIAPTLTVPVFGPGYTVAPWFYINTTTPTRPPGMVVLARYRSSQLPAIVSLAPTPGTPNYTTVFSGTVNLPTELLASIAAQAGVHLFLGNQDGGQDQTTRDIVDVGVVAGNRDAGHNAVLLIVASSHSALPAPRNVTLPQTAAAVTYTSFGTGHGHGHGAFGPTSATHSTTIVVCRNCSQFQTPLMAPGDVGVFYIDGGVE